MTPDLICLLVLALWTLPLNHIPALARFQQADLAWALSNRDTSPDVPPWVGRADRAQRNHLDNLAMIAAIILITAVTSQNDDITAIAAIVVVAMRITHSLAYIAGQPVVRSSAYAVSVLALFTIVWRLVV